MISVFDSGDPLHNEALRIFKLILAVKDLKCVVPTTVFHEALCTLLRNNLNSRIVTEKLLKFIMIKDVINYQITETSLLKLVDNYCLIIKNMPNGSIAKTPDSTIVSVAMEFPNSYLVTSDKGMKNAHKTVYPNIYCFQDSNDIQALEAFLTS